MSNMVAPPIPPDVDLRNFPFTPIYRARLFASAFHAKATDSEWRAGMTLWLKSWDQHPSGSLPNDDVELCRLAEFGRDVKLWLKLKPMALSHWELADDGRLYHAVVSGYITEAWNKKLAGKKRTKAARAARRKTSATENATENVTEHVTQNNREKGSVATPESEPKLLNLESFAAPAHEDAKFSNKINGADPEGRSAPLASASPSPSPDLRTKRKELLRQKLMRFADARLPAAERSAAIAGLCGTDSEHDDQWWLDRLDRKMRRAGWDDTEIEERRA